MIITANDMAIARIMCGTGSDATPLQKHQIRSERWPGDITLSRRHWQRQQIHIDELAG